MHLLFFYFFPTTKSIFFREKKYSHTLPFGGLYAPFIFYFSLSLSSSAKEVFPPHLTIWRLDSSNASDSSTNTPDVVRFFPQRVKSRQMYASTLVARASGKRTRPWALGDLRQFEHAASSETPPFLKGLSSTHFGGKHRSLDVDFELSATPSFHFILDRTLQFE